MEKICDIAEAIMSITDNDVAETQEMIDGQRRYNNPLRMATTARQRMLAEHNQKVLDGIVALRKVIEEGEKIPNIGVEQHMKARDLKSGDCFIWHGVEVCSVADYGDNEDALVFVTRPDVYEHDCSFYYTDSGFECIMPDEELEFTRRIECRSQNVD